jgi:hypothetical protein
MPCGCSAPRVTRACELNAIHLKRQWGLTCATTWHIHIVPSGALCHVNGSVAAHRTHLRAFEGHKGISRRDKLICMLKV